MGVLDSVEATEFLQSFNELLLEDLLPNDNRAILERRGDTGSGDIRLNHSRSSGLDPTNISENVIHINSSIQGFKTRGINKVILDYSILKRIKHF